MEVTLEELMALMQMLMDTGTLEHAGKKDVILALRRTDKGEFAVDVYGRK